MNTRRLDAIESRVGKMKLPPQSEVDFSRWRDDPIGFITDVLGGESAHRRSDWGVYQFEVLADLNCYPRVAVRSGHGTGKTTLDAWAALWWHVTRPMSRVVILAPEFSRQIRAVVFAELRKWVKRSRIPLPVEVLSNRVLANGHGDEWGIIGVPAAEPSRLEGFHSDAGVLLILDECKGVPQDVFDAMQGALSGHGDNRLLITSGP